MSKEGTLLDKYLEGIQCYIKGENRDKFMRELHKIPNVTEEFEKLLKQNPKWCEVARNTSVQCYLDVNSIKVKKRGEPNRMTLLIFESGQQPVIKIY